MDIKLNDGTVATNVSILEYEHLKEKGYVGQKYASNLVVGTIDSNKTVTGNMCIDEEKIKNYPPYLDSPKPIDYRELETNKMRELVKKHGDDPETFHAYADDLICDILLKYGYTELVDLFNNTDKWYS